MLTYFHNKYKIFFFDRIILYLINIMIFSVIICFFINFIYKFDILLIDVNIYIIYKK